MGETGILVLSKGPGVRESLPYFSNYSTNVLYGATFLPGDLLRRRAIVVSSVIASPR